ncbi:hypothetical protein GPLA_2203 [Paraglaciecola polaris LMG 21857]|uniref:Uncharacterized protein n=1 Tax=Paraglaciecola polaris LMG 21857 TaxID=1129793 RepID=K6ZWE6_9ALTE|nr:hypothetical protein GPLA_2203 [Paraglaciecola polaris LMG 21857]
MPVEHAEATLTCGQIFGLSQCAYIRLRHKQALHLQGLFNKRLVLIKS